MKKSSMGSLALAIFFVIAHHLEAAEPLSEDPLTANVFAVSNRLLLIYPAASIQVTNATIGVTHRMTTHKVRLRNKLGQLSDKEKEVNGPEADGFSISIRFGQGSYNEQMARSTVLILEKSRAGKRGPFFYSGAAKNWPEKGVYMVTDLQFGADADTNKVAEVHRLLVQAAEKTVLGSKQ